MDAEKEILEGPVTHMLEYQPAAEPDAATIAAAAMLEYNYSSTQLRTEEVEMACNATVMGDDTSHPLLSDSIFEAINIAIEESEK